MDQATLQAVLAADKQQLLLAIFVVGLPGALALLFKIIDIRRARLDHADKSEEKAQEAEAEEKKRQDQVALDLIGVVSNQVNVTSSLIGKIDAMTQELHRANDLNEQRNLLRDKRDTEQTGAIREQTKEIAQNTLNLADVESTVGEAKAAVIALPAHIDKAKDAVAEKIDSAVEKSLSEIASKLTPIMAQLTTQALGIEDLQSTVGTLQKKLDDVSALLPPDLKDLNKKFDDLKTAAEKTFDKITEADLAAHDAQSQVVQMAAQVEALQNPTSVVPEVPKAASA